MLQQSVFARVAHREHFVRLVLNYPVSAAMECLEQIPINLTFYRAKHVPSGHFAKIKDHFPHQYVLQDLIQVKHQRQYALFVQQGHTPTFSGASSYQTAKYVRPAHTAPKDPLARFSAMQEHSAVTLDLLTKRIASKLPQVSIHIGDHNIQQIVQLGPSENIQQQNRNSNA